MFALEIIALTVAAVTAIWFVCDAIASAFDK